MRTMKGCLIVNAFLASDKFNEIYSFLHQAFEARTVELQRLDNCQAMQLVQDCNVQYDFVLFWDKDIYLARALERLGYRVFNSSYAISTCDDKALTYTKLINCGVDMPKTITAPMTYANIGYSNYDFVHFAAQQLGFPLVIKENFGSFGQQVYLAKDINQALLIVKQIAPKPFLFQQFVAAANGVDVRIQVVGQQVVAAVQRTAPPNEFRANVTIGGKMTAYTPTHAQNILALRVCELLQLDFAGVDILTDHNGQPLLCEVNSNAQFKNLYDATGVNAADYIAEMIVSKCSAQ